MNKKNLIFIAIVCLTALTFSQSQIKPNDFEEKADAYLNALNSRGQFSGSVLIANKGEIIFNKGYGWASKRFKIKNNPSVKYRIASITKSFTAIAMLHLVDAGVISLDDNISKYLDYPYGNKITVKQLLSHTSGLKRDINFPDEHKKYGLKELVVMSQVDSLLFEPGTRTHYSNCNYILLQSILEQVSGMDYETYLTKNVLHPLGLKNTGIEHPLSPPNQLADGYQAGKDKNGHFEVQETSMSSHSYPDAVTALYSTTEDVFKFCQQLGKSDILKPETWQLAFTPVVSEHPFLNWGLGFTIIGNGNTKILNHNGRTTGFKGGYYYDLNEDFTLVILGNNANIARSLIVNTLQTILEGKEYYQPKTYTKVAIDKASLRDYVGEYTSDNFSFSISEYEGQLYVKSHGDAPSVIYPYKEDCFYSKYFDLEISFKRKSGIINQAEWTYLNEKTLTERVNL